MNKRILILMLAMTLLLTGCQLAVETVNEQGMHNPDRLVGVVVTTEYLDLFDMEGYLDDNLGAIMAGKNPDQFDYQGRLYAQEEVEYSITEDGKDCYTTYYNFDHVDGIALLYYTAYTYTESGELLAEFTIGVTDDGLWDVHFSMELTEGSVYFSENSGEIMLYVNPVYQDSDGKLYLVQGDCMHSADGLGSMSMWYTETQTETTGGESSTRKREIKITAEWVPVAERLALIQMNAENQIIARQEYIPEELPEELTPEADCAYIILEQYAGGEVTRQMLQKEDTYFTVHIMGDAPYCLGTSTNILWP